MSSNYISYICDNLWIFIKTWFEYMIFSIIVITIGFSFILTVIFGIYFIIILPFYSINLIIHNNINFNNDQFNIGFIMLIINIIIGIIVTIKMIYLRNGYTIIEN